MNPGSPRVPSGIVVVDKPAGVTSFDVVGLVRRRLGVRRVGHAGTLDPDATGVLPILLGEATKLMAYLADHEKVYRAVVRLGVRTDTQDLTGRVLSEVPVPALDRTTVAAAARRFVGRIGQTPPMYSAVHHDGRRLYELAREGVEVERAPREVVVHAIDVEDVSGARVTLRVVCGKGTYVRTLAADIGDALGVGGAVEQLRRLRVGPFGDDDAVTWERLRDAPVAELRGRIAPPESALAGWMVVHLDERRATAFRHGQPVESRAGAPGMARVHDETGALVGVGEVDADTGRVRPVRILHADRSDARVLPA
ncbi:MAG: tRNA pseudouridine(55) synthase TruB [Candidatus Rokubacteria bacterium]|nr:tRNA pseudouridine(55) synthase TruB [Candidatus Rokubacteria bacterium]